MAKNYPVNTHFLIADGAQATLYQNQSGSEIALRQIEDWYPVSLENDGPSGNLPPESSQQAIDEATFAKQVAQRLHKMVQSGTLQKLVLVADPQTLGQLRACLHKEVKDKLVADFNKTLTNASIEEIHRSLKVDD